MSGGGRTVEQDEAGGEALHVKLQAGVGTAHALHDDVERDVRGPGCCGDRARGIAQHDADAAIALELAHENAVRQHLRVQARCNLRIQIEVL